MKLKYYYNGAVFTFRFYLYSILDYKFWYNVKQLMYSGKLSLGNLRTF